MSAFELQNVVSRSWFAALTGPLGPLGRHDLNRDAVDLAALTDLVELAQHIGTSKQRTLDWRVGWHPAQR